jgi:hypothetical protein
MFLSQHNSSVILKPGPARIRGKRTQKERQQSKLRSKHQKDQRKIRRRKPLASNATSFSPIWEKKIVYYVGKIKETVSKTNFEVSFLHNMKKSSTFVFPDVEEDALIELSDIVMPLAEPF